VPQLRRRRDFDPPRLTYERTVGRSRLPARTASDVIGRLWKGDSDWPHRLGAIKHSTHVSSCRNQEDMLDRGRPARSALLFCPASRVRFVCAHRVEVSYRRNARALCFDDLNGAAA
jgi:hypothetical protein